MWWYLLCVFYPPHGFDLIDHVPIHSFIGMHKDHVINKICQKIDNFEPHIVTKNKNKELWYIGRQSYYIYYTVLVFNDNRLDLIYDVKQLPRAITNKIKAISKPKLFKKDNAIISNIFHVHRVELKPIK